MRRWSATYLAVLIAAAAAFLGVLPGPATGAPNNTVDYVVVAGAAGLRWDDVTPDDTPTLWRLAQQGSIGALSVRSGHEPTCAADGWATLGAGNYARLTYEQLNGEACPPLGVKIETPDALGARLPDYLLPGKGYASTNRNESGTQLGALAESVRCTTAFGPGAAVAAARPYGRVDRYVATIPDDPTELLSSCVLSFVDLGTVQDDGALRRSAARTADAQLARILAARPNRSLLIIAGLADTDTTSRLHVAIADGPGYGGGWLTSSSTSRSGYLQLIDLAPTALNALGRPTPSKLIKGAPAVRTEGRPADLTAAVGRLSDADREAGAQRRVAGTFFGVLTFCLLVLLAVMVPVLRRVRRPPGPIVPASNPPWLVRGVEILLVAAALAVPAALVADLVPWWRAAMPGPVFTVAALTVLAAATAAITRSRLGRTVLGPLGGVSAVAAGIVAMDVLTGASLQLNGVAGYSALTGGRYAGMGAVGLGVFVAGILLAGGCLAMQVRRAWRPLVMAVVGGVGVVVVGSPFLGADAGGAVALTAGVCIAAAMSTGGWLTFARLAWAVLAGVGVTAGFALLDAGRPVDERGSLGRFLVQVSDGSSGLVIRSIGVDNRTTIADSPLTLLVIGAAAILFFALLRPWAGMKRLFGLYPPVRGALVGGSVASLLAGAVDGVGFNVLGAAVATALPLAVLASLRVLGHADERTQPAPPAAVAVPQPPAEVPEPA